MTARARPDALARAALMAAALVVSAGACASPPQAVSLAQTYAEAGFASLRRLDPDLRMDIRYAGAHNFVGTPIDGYETPDCQLLQPAADALLRVEHALRAVHRRLLVFDCYRPVRAVAHFMRWARDAGAPGSKREFYPDLDKVALVPQYIAEHSGHSRGATVDLTLMQCDVRGARYEALDMGTGFDFFGEAAHTDSPSITSAQAINRGRLRDAMAGQGFENYADEWWHYTLRPEPAAGTAYDFPVR